ncbi:unnamed protein product [Brachionus calyciflorus]|uniref:Chitin-binding type-2 domain-containing protein n=1 Tax=Brachionus calyciflorus TaxID=104777 RepID=A0A813Y559_9BILA|nr:unnamed protein product [Brachionus calyciflorus]
MNFKVVLILCLIGIFFNGISCQLKLSRNEDLEQLCINGDGYFTDAKYQCKVFYRCVNIGQPGFEIKTFHCPPGLYFDSRRNLCDRPENVQCF